MVFIIIVITLKHIFVIFFVKIEIFDLHAVSIFATGTGESDTTTHTPFCKLWNTIQRNNQCNDYNDENHEKGCYSLIIHAYILVVDY
jgi:hypothetical protein